MDDIWQYTVDRWGDARAEHYVRELGLRLGMIAENPELGPSIDEIRPGYRKYPIGTHVVFYRPTADGIYVGRILHGRMDATRHLRRR